MKYQLERKKSERERKHLEEYGRVERDKQLTTSQSPSIQPQNPRASPRMEDIKLADIKYSPSPDRKSRNLSVKSSTSSISSSPMSRLSSTQHNILASRRLGTKPSLVSASAASSPSVKSPLRRFSSSATSSPSVKSPLRQQELRKSVSVSPLRKGFLTVENEHKDRSRTLRSNNITRTGLGLQHRHNGHESEQGIKEK